ncbi:hypothetical protein SADUNF_Sadunf10G0078800 [Salix dunnii]|uniref:Secreted protein n=1 Tax=Salix dunnii TaxID=1413687 RepID=A0A835JMH5_9ROSI|nr:hypothetical protein SADUNF_Sadunf10G0078800 [Salix dunnii]
MEFCSFAFFALLVTGGGNESSQRFHLDGQHSSLSCTEMDCCNAYLNWSTGQMPHFFTGYMAGKGFLPSFFNGKSVFLTESRSLAPASMRGNKNCREKKKGGLWSKLLCRPKYKKVEGGLVRYSRFNPIRKGLVGD